MSQQTVGAHDMIDMQLTLDWKSEQGRHREIRHYPNYNIWRDMDLLPASLQQEILHNQYLLQPLVPSKSHRTVGRSS